MFNVKKAVVFTKGLSDAENEVRFDVISDDEYATDEKKHCQEGYQRAKYQKKSANKEVDQISSGSELDKQTEFTTKKDFRAAADVEHTSLNSPTEAIQLGSFIVLCCTGAKTVWQST